MTSYLWQSDSVLVGVRVHVDVKASEKSVVLAQGDDVWFHDLHLTPESARSIAVALIEGADKCESARTP